jgi:hypothetical protein
VARSLESGRVLKSTPAGGQLAVNSDMRDDHFADPAPLPEPAGSALSPRTLSEPEQRFQSCRWHKPGDGSQPAHCTHREVLPMAGAHGFSAESWCPDCGYFKLRRVPRRTPAASPP